MTVPEVEVFPPGTWVKMKGDNERDPSGWIFLVLEGGYVTTSDWAFHVATTPFTSEVFERTNRNHGLR